jgi:serine/threonine protein kinase/tetratricopeptide (TPR) repeat protein
VLAEPVDATFLGRNDEKEPSMSKPTDPDDVSADALTIERDISMGTASPGKDAQETVVFRPDDPAPQTAPAPEATLVVAPDTGGTVIMDGSELTNQPPEPTLVVPAGRSDVQTIMMTPDAPVDDRPTMQEEVVDKRKTLDQRTGDRPTVERFTDDRNTVDETAPAAGAGEATVSIPGYRILGELGRGGMGVVYKARQLGLNRTVALKMIIAGAHASGDQVLRFQAEAEAVARLLHPNIVQVYDIGKQDGLPYFSLEFVDGKPLDRDLEGKPQTEKRAAELTETLARAMHYAHENGIMHRDLKPANVLLSKSGVPKITDFGLAKQLEGDSSQTKTGTIMGTPSYMAPEQGRGEKTINHLADVYALGSMLYEFLTGRPPFLAPTPLKTLMRLLHEEPVPPSRIQPGISRDLETICVKCLQKDPQRRYETAGALAEDLRRFQAGEAILARRVSRTELAWRWCKRNPKIAALSGSVAVLLLAVAVSVSLMLIRISRDRAAIAETRQQGEQRLEQATLAISQGNFGRAKDLLKWSDPLMTSAADLQELRGKLQVLNSQVDNFARFRELLDRVRYLGLYGGLATALDGRGVSHELITLYDQIEQQQESGNHGWPPLNPQQEQLLKEDVFDLFLVSSNIELTASQVSGDLASKQAAARHSIELLNRAEKILPGTKAFLVWRGGCFELLGQKEAQVADHERSHSIEATSAVDRFWHAYADYGRAEDALKKGDGKSAGSSYRLAATGFTKVIEVRPESFWAYFSWALCLSKLGDRYGAVVGYTNCSQLRPDVPWPYTNRGLMHFQLGERDPALADFSKAIEVGPHDPTAYGLRGQFYFMTGERALAKADYAAGLKLQPANAEYRRSHGILNLVTKDLDGSLADWDELRKLVPNSHEPYSKRGGIFLGRHEFDKALAEYEAAIQKKGDDLDSLTGRATIHRWQGQTDAALAEINHIVNKLVPDKHDYIVERADLLRSLGRYDEAIEDYQRCVTLHPKQTDGYLGLAQVYEKQDRPILARECYERMIKADSASAAVYLYRAEFLRSHGDYDAALADCDLAAKIDPKSVIPEFVRAGIIAAQGKPEQAVKDLDQLLKGAPPQDGKVLYAAACAWSLAAQAAAKSADRAVAALAPEYAARGAKLLAEVEGACFHDLQYPEHNRMAWDPALEGIRGLPEVQKLLEGRK